MSQAIRRLRELSDEVSREWRGMMESVERLSCLIDQAGLAVISANLEGEITSWNPAAERLFGWSEAEVLGRNVTLVIPERMRQRHRAGLAAYRETGYGRLVGRYVRLSALHRDGHELDVELMLSGFHTSAGRFVAAIIRRANGAEQYEAEGAGGS